MDKYRFNLELSPAVKERLDELQKRTEAASLTEVIRKALAVYDALESKAKDWDIVLRSKKDKKTEMPVLLV